MKLRTCDFPLPHSRTGCRAGFTLIEVIIAMALLSICLVMIMQLFAGGLKSARTSCDYTRAVIIAKDKMEELSINPVSESGEFEEGYRWETEALPYEEGEGYNLMKIKVKVFWGDVSNRERSIELVSLKVVSDEDEPL